MMLLFMAELHILGQRASNLRHQSLVKAARYNPNDIAAEVQ